MVRRSSVSAGIATVCPNVVIMFISCSAELLTGFDYYTYTGIFIVNSLLVEGFSKSLSFVTQDIHLTLVI